MERFAADLATPVRTPLALSYVQVMRKTGQVVQFQAVDTVQEPGAETALFHYVLEGELEAIDPVTNSRTGAATLGR